jgi:nicotinate-nucleotide adenylyltransferase
MSGNFRSRTALFGGSFNPPHLGHVEAVRGLYRNPGVARVRVIPSFGTPLKETSTDYTHRFAMAELAFSPLAEVDPIEGQERTGTTFELLSRLGDSAQDCAFVIGTDQLETLERWFRFPEVLYLCDWIVLLRAPGGRARAEAAAKKLVTLGVLQSGKDASEFTITNGRRRLVLIETEAPELSSTFIRERWALKSKETTKPLLPEAVYDYMERNRLYGT